MLATHMKGSAQEFYCPKEGCGQLFTTIPKLRLHLSHQHSTVSTFTPRIYPCMMTGCNTVSMFLCIYRIDSLTFNVNNKQLMFEYFRIK